MFQSKKRWLSKILPCVILLVVAVFVAPHVIQAAGAQSGARALLKQTLDYCDSMDQTKYTADTWEAFQTEKAEAQTVYDNTTFTDSAYSNARDELEKVKAALMYVPSEKEANPAIYRELTADEIVAEMGAGWNLGNTMDGHTDFTPSETALQSVATTKELIKAVHDLGFNTIRIPVTWGTMINDKKGYAIKSKWISRVQDIVDYCISQDMYVIINIQDDGAEQTGWLRVAANDIDPVYEKFEGVWRSIAERFKNYDEHLIFESMNEITGGEESDEATYRDTQVINNLNQIFVNVVRSTGSNNAVRWLSVPGRYANIDKTTDPKYGFTLPTDVVENRLFVSVHYYDWTFGMQENIDVTTFSYDKVKELAASFQKLVDTFTSKGVPVILGEYGAVNKDNEVKRAYHLEAITRICQLSKVVACYWDQGWYDRTLIPDYSFSLIDRNTGNSIDPAITDAIMRGTYLPAASENYSDIVKDTKVEGITYLKISDENISMVIGDSKKLTTEYAPIDTNDVILWKTDDETVATVSNGNIRARGIGTTTLTAFSQSGSIDKTIHIEVNAKKGDSPVTEINFEKTDYEVKVGGHVNLEPNLTPAGTDAYVTYRSSNEAIASVSALGKIVGKSAGTAYITAAASSGVTKTVRVTVTGADKTNGGQGGEVEAETLAFQDIQEKEVVNLKEIGDTFDLSAVITPSNANATVAFVSSDESIVYVNHEAVTVDSIKGSATVTLTAIGEGSAVITAMTENGLKAQFTVLVGEIQVEPSATVTPPTGTPDTSTGTVDEDKSDIPVAVIVIIVLLSVIGTGGGVIIAILRMKAVKKKQDKEDIKDTQNK